MADALKIRLLVVAMHIDWFRVISDLERSGFTQRRISRHLLASKSSVAYWKQGGEPRYSDGARLIQLWALVTRQTADNVPFMGNGGMRYRKQ